MTLTIRMEQKSVKAFTKRLGQIMGATIQGGRMGVHNAAVDVLTEAQINVPVDSGALKQSGKVTDATDGIRSTVSYGDATTNSDGISTSTYAVIRHETPNQKNPHTDKWLERALLQETGKAFSTIAEAVRQSWLEVS